MTISNVVIFDQLLHSMCALCANLRCGFLSRMPMLFYLEYFLDRAYLKFDFRHLS